MRSSVLPQQPILINDKASPVMTLPYIRAQHKIESRLDIPPPVEPTPGPAKHTLKELSDKMVVPEFNPSGANLWMSPSQLPVAVENRPIIQNDTIMRISGLETEVEKMKTNWNRMNAQMKNLTTLVDSNPKLNQLIESHQELVTSHQKNVEDNREIVKVNQEVIQTNRDVLEANREITQEYQTKVSRIEEEQKKLVKSVDAVEQAVLMMAMTRTPSVPPFWYTCLVALGNTLFTVGLLHGVSLMMPEQVVGHLPYT